VTKLEIMRHVGPSLAVEESNIRFQIAELRAALGEDRDLIKSLSGRGYVFALDAPSDAILPSQTIRLEGTSEKTLPAWEGDAGPDRGGSPVVVIDDDPHTREALQSLLRSVGLHVELFGSVQAFLSTHRESAPGCIILDVCLPGRSGLDFHAEFAKAHPRIPVIFISGHADVPMSVRAMKAGAMEFLTKPVRHHDLLEAIQSAMNR
jgi:DNA-binding response OmpR family regulator